VPQSWLRAFAADQQQGPSSCHKPGDLQGEVQRRQLTKFKVSCSIHAAPLRAHIFAHRFARAECVLERFDEEQMPNFYVQPLHGLDRYLGAPT